MGSDLARLYDVETKALNRAVRRNAERFPKDFMFQLNRAEFDNLKRIPQALATSVVVATNRWAMLSTITPKPSSVLTPSRVMSPASAKTTSSLVS